MMRSFIAIPVPQERAAALLDVQRALGVGRLVPPENWHVTLAFAGDQPVAALERLDEGLRGLAAPGFDMRIAGVDIFGRRHPALLFAGVARSEPLVQLRGKVRAAVRAAGIALPRERFRPHVTLARFSRRMTAMQTRRIAGVLAVWGDLDAGCIPVSRIALYRSQLGPDGPIYEALADYPLGQR